MRFLAAGLLAGFYCLFCWLCWQKYRREQHQPVPAAMGAGAADVVIAYASQSGNAARIAHQTAAQLQAAGTPALLVTLNQLGAEQLLRTRQLLIIASTYGEGEAPDNGNRFLARTLASVGPGALRSLEYLVLGLGDASYAHFCGFAQQLHNGLHQRGANAIADMIAVNRLEESALRHWQYYLGKISGSSHFSDWSKPAYQDWQLVGRDCVNPASPGAPAYHLQLQPYASLDVPGDSSYRWQAGDIVEIGPCNSPAAIDRFLQRINRTLPPELLREKDLAVDDARLGALCLLDDAGLIESLADLSHREYSIASSPEEGTLDLLVRQVRLPRQVQQQSPAQQLPQESPQHSPQQSPQELGIGSGWLTQHAPLNTPIRLRIRSNPHFHSPPVQRPLILIGNGTGIAGLRSHLANPARASGKHWLFFGERTQFADDFFAADMVRWQQMGLLTRVDKVFSRDAAHNEPRYVQELLLPNASMIRAWVEAGAAIYVCGSLQGMAQAVDAALTSILGAAEVERMADEQRYCRDVY